jgi:hypothetical protein
MESLIVRKQRRKRHKIYSFDNTVKNEPMNAIINEIYLLLYTFNVDMLTTEST